MNAASLTSRLFQILLVVALLIAGVAGAWLLIASKPSAPKATSHAARETLVEIEPIQRTDHHATVGGYGTVRAYQEVNVQPQVSGVVVRTSPSLQSGGLFRQGEELFQIDPRDYQNAVEQQKAAVATAQYNLKLEEGNQTIAKREWALLGDTIETNDLGRDLALRKPQLADRQAALAAAESQLANAELNLERTTVKAPFNSVVIEESVDVGQLVGPGSGVVRLVNTDEFYVQVSVPVGELDWVRASTAGQVGSKVKVIYDLGDGRHIEREGTVLRRLADVDTNGRLGRLLITVKDPLDLADPAEKRQPLLLGAYVRVEIEGPVLENVFVLNRRSVREGDRVWVRNGNGELEFRDIDIILGSDDDVVVRGDLADGDELIVSNLPAALPGMKVTALPARTKPARDAAAKPVAEGDHSAQPTTSAVPQPRLSAPTPRGEGLAKQDGLQP